MLYHDAERLSRILHSHLTRGCKRIEVVGSVKRGDKTECGDIEILCIADEHTPRPEFGQKNPPTTMIEKVIQEMQEANILGHAKLNGEKLKKFPILNTGEINPFYLEIYIVQPDTWAIQNVIRTGPSLFSHAFVTNKKFSFYDEKTNAHYRGLLPNQYEYLRGQTKIKLVTILDLTEEQDAIELLGHGWIPPKSRGDYVKSVTNVTA